MIKIILGTAFIMVSSFTGYQLSQASSLVMPTGTSPPPQDYESWDRMKKLEWLMSFVDDTSNVTYVSEFLRATIHLPYWLGGTIFTMYSGLRKYDGGPDFGKLTANPAKIFSWTWENIDGHPYTGGFTESDGIAKIMLGPDPTPVSNNGAISVKILRDRIHSSNLPFRHSVWPLTSPNIFAPTFSNHIESVGFKPTKIGAMNKIQELKNSSYDPMTNMVGSSDNAMYDKNGNRVIDWKNPFQIFISPNPELTKKCSSVAGFEDGPYYQCLENIQPGKRIWKVWARENPQSEKLIPIGYIKATSTAMKSDWHAINVYYKHTLWAVEMENIKKERQRRGGSLEGPHEWEAAESDEFRAKNSAKHWEERFDFKWNDERF